jgi:hypothetical protein
MTWGFRLAAGPARSQAGGPPASFRFSSAATEAHPLDRLPPRPEASAGEAELAQHAHVVAACPVLGDPAVLDAEDVDLLDRHAAAGGRPAQELARLGAPRGAPQRDPVTVTEDVIDVLAAALTRIEIYRILSSEFGWSHDRITDLLTTVVRSALLG